MSRYARVAEQDHIDRFLEYFGSRLTGVDLVVEGIVDRISGLNKRLHREMNETIEDFGLNYGEFKVLGTLWRAGEPHRMSPGHLARIEELSTGAMTNRLDRLEEAKLVRREPDPAAADVPQSAEDLRLRPHLGEHVDAHDPAFGLD